jgi:putative endonuclease
MARGPIHVGATAPTPVTFFMSGCYYVYILANRRYGTLYVGITNNIVRRVFEHRIDLVEGFTKEHQVHHLVWYESHDDVLQAIVREKRIKKWRRDWKVNLIQGASIRSGRICTRNSSSDWAPGHRRNCGARGDTHIPAAPGVTLIFQRRPG